jgi:hypothetical protein
VVQELEVRGKGITIYDEDTGQPVCVKSKSLNVTATEGKCDTQNNPDSDDQNEEIVNNQPTATSTMDTVTSPPIIDENNGN